MTTAKKILDEIGRLSLMVSIPQLISAPLLVILISIFSPVPTPGDIKAILDFLVISFPLTLAIALMTYFIMTGNEAFLVYIAVIVGAAMLSNLLHGLISSAFPAADIDAAYRQAFEPDALPTRRGTGTFVNFALNIINIYWRDFGIVLFLQSCVIGIYCGTRYFRKERGVKG